MSDPAASYERSFEIFSGAHGLAGDELEAYLNEACGEDAELLARVRDAAREELSGATNAYDIN